MQAIQPGNSSSGGGPPGEGKQATCAFDENETDKARISQQQVFNSECFYLISQYSLSFVRLQKKHLRWGRLQFLCRMKY